MKSLQKHLPFLFIVAVWFIFASPYFLQGKVPYPSSYQGNNFSPWSSYQEFWGPVKNGAMPDIITQIYPWRHFTIESWKNGQIPLWNPYSFSGTPHLANYQSGVFSPFNVLFFVFSFVDAWSILVLLQPLLAGLFIYLYVRTLKVSIVSSLVSSVSFMFCGFITVWMGYATLGYAILFLPLALFAVEKYHQTNKIRHLILLALTIPLSFFSGHFQTSLYFLIFVIAYIVFKFFSTKNILNTFYLILYTLSGLFLAMPQILPSIEFYQQSVRSNLFQKGEVIPWSYFPTFLAPDFFGNPVTRNDWLGHYAEWNAYIGVFPFLLAVYTLFRKKLNDTTFFLVMAILSFLLAFDTPIVDFLAKLHVPVFSTSAASRVIVIFSFSMTVLAGFGLDDLIDDITRKRTKKIASWLVSCLLFFLVLWGIVIFKLFIPVDKIGIAKSNLVLPTVLFFLGAASIFFQIIIKKNKFIFLISYFILLLVSFDLLRFSIKWMPFDPREKVFARVPVSDYFSKISGYDRALGNYEAGIATYYHIPSVEGYDPLYIGRYGEFVSALDDGKVQSPFRSVVNFSRNGVYVDKAIDLLGIKYIIHKTSDNYVGWTFPVWNHPEQFKKVFDDGKYQVFENTKAFPRAFLVGKYVTVDEQQKIIDTMFDVNTDLRSKVILEHDPETKKASLQLADAKIMTYSANKIDIETNSDQDAILVLSDNYYPGWKGYVDSHEVPIYRADYTFRSLVVPKGAHKVQFIYDPWSFRVGLYLAGIGVFGLIIQSLRAQRSNLKRSPRPSGSR